MKILTAALLLVASDPYNAIFNIVHVSACGTPPDKRVIAAHRQMRKRMPQAGAIASSQSTTASGVSSTTTTASATTSAVSVPIPTDPYGTVPLVDITSGAPSDPIATLHTTFAAGATPPVSGAPVLPSPTLNIAAYPPANTVPPVDSPQVTEWMKEIANVPAALLNMNPTINGDPQTDTADAADHSRCWWTANGCTDPNVDIVECPTKLTWGVSFDDGPSPCTPKVIDYLSRNNITGTFFVVGSRLTSPIGPSILQAEYMLGHQIAVHTWSHSVPLTALTNEEVVAELGWSRQAIKDVIGVTPLFWRPPWGDIDNRIRAIGLAMGMSPIIWTREPTTLAQFDTNDWQVPAGTKTGEQSVAQFQNILTNATLLDTGFIVLEHDLWDQECDLSTGYFLPAAQKAGFTLQDINTCIGGQPSDAYLETIANKSAIPSEGSSSNSTGSVPSGGSSNSTGPSGSTGGNAAQGSGAQIPQLSIALSLLTAAVGLGLLSPS